MDLAKPGLIKHYCLPNALTTFKEYLKYYAGEETTKDGLALIEKMISEIPGKKIQDTTRDMLARIDQGEQDLYL